MQTDREINNAKAYLTNNYQAESVHSGNKQGKRLAYQKTHTSAVGTQSN